MTVVGYAATISVGEWITASGEGVNDRTHGQQFKARFPAHIAADFGRGHRKIPCVRHDPGRGTAQADDPETAVDRIIELAKAQNPKRSGLDPIRSFQVLLPMNQGGIGARSLNIELKAALNRAGDRKVERFGWTFALGDKVMLVENDSRRSTTVISATSVMLTSTRARSL